MNIQPNTNLLEIHHVSAGYGKLSVIHDINIKIQSGQIVALLGSNGLGKTTILRTIIGQTKLIEGKILFDGKDLTTEKTHLRAARGISYCPEGRAIFGNLSCRENLQAGGYLLDSNKDFQKNLEWVYSLFPILKEREHQIAESLSGGEQEMLAISRALMSNPKLMLLDEPSLGLAPQIVQRIALTLREINTSGVSVLLVEQNAHLALELASYGYLMKKGTVTLEGSTQELANNDFVKKVYLGAH